MTALTARRDTHSGGFTLIELLVALTLFGVISVVVMGGLRFGTRVWESGDARAQALAEVEAVQGILRRYMSQAIVPQTFRIDAEDSGVFIGEADRLRLVTVVPAHIGIGGLYQVEIGMADRDSGDDGALELKWTLFRPDDPLRIEELGEEEDTLIGGHRTLLSGVKSVRFAYYGEGDRGFSEAEWQEAWHEVDLLPNLISLNVEFAEGIEQIWPELVVQVRLMHAGR